MYKLNFYILIVVVLASCNKKNTPTKSAYSEIGTLVDAQKSIVCLPIKMSNIVLASKINSLIPNIVFKDEKIEDDNYSFTVSKLGNLGINSAEEGFMFSIPLKVEAKAKIDIGGFTGTYPIYCEIKPKFQIIPSVTSDWKIKIKTIAQGFEWLANPSVKVGFFKVDVTTMAELVLRNQQALIAEMLDTYFENKIDLKPNLKQLWSIAQEPILLSAENQCWFRFVPDSIAIMPIFTSKDFLKTGFRLKGNTEVVFGQKPQKTNIMLPNAENTTITSSDFSVFTPIYISHDFLTSVAKKQLLQKTFTFDGNKTLTIDDLKLGQKNQIFRSESDVSGTYNGKVVLEGNPYFDSTSQTIQIKNLDFEFDTKNKLHKTASWLSQGKILKTLGPFLQFDMSHQLNDIEINIKKFLATNKITPQAVLNGKLTKIVPEKQIFISDKNYVLQLRVNGISEIEILKIE